MERGRRELNNDGGMRELAMNHRVNGVRWFCGASQIFVGSVCRIRAGCPIHNKVRY